MDGGAVPPLPITIQLLGYLHRQMTLFTRQVPVNLLALASMNKFT